jgi:transcriptional regulator
MHELIRAHPLAALVTVGREGLTASHVPMVIDPDPAPYGTLRCHLSRANPQWRDFSADAQALAIFGGPERYISPNWYATKAQTGKVVPTWNYAVVHAYGRLRVIEDAAWLRAFVTRLTDVHEARSPRPWKVEDAPEDYVAAQLSGIVGIEMPVARLEGKWKVNQNRPVADRESVVEALSELEDGRDLAELVRSRLDDGVGITGKE